MNWYTADTHFFHKNVIEYCKRPFANIEEMNETIIERWNSKISKEDTVFHLGDFSFGKKLKTREILERLNGEIILIVGNHDYSDHKKLFKNSFHAWHTIISNQEISLSHYPFEPQAGEDYDNRYPERRLKNNGQWLLHGHVHCAWTIRRKMINVGVDVHNYFPISQDEIMRIIFE